MRFGLSLFRTHSQRRCVKVFITNVEWEERRSQEEKILKSKVHQPSAVAADQGRDTALHSREGPEASAQPRCLPLSRRGQGPQVQGDFPGPARGEKQKQLSCPQELAL